ncbi:hypothetical protein CPT_Slocum_033 [Serratia phage Slocum]|nr:hypothetical protein CPT_Slocum_033 [Serratia phage Slocum]
MTNTYHENIRCPLNNSVMLQYTRAETDGDALVQDFIEAIHIFDLQQVLDDDGTADGRTLKGRLILRDVWDSVLLNLHRICTMQDAVKVVEEAYRAFYGDTK